MIKTFFCCVVIFFSARVSAQQTRSPFKQAMYRDLKVTNTITKTLQDTIFTFHVEAADDDNKQVDLSREYYWFHQGEVRKTQGAYTGKLLHGPFEKFDRNGNLLAKGIFEHGLKDGDWLTWYLNGAIARQYNWKHGQRTGIFVEYYPSGGKLKSGKFKHDRLYGKVSYYAQDGNVVREEKYVNGKISKVKEKHFSLRRKKKVESDPKLLQTTPGPVTEPNQGDKRGGQVKDKTSSTNEITPGPPADKDSAISKENRRRLFRKKKKHTDVAPPSGPTNPAAIYLPTDQNVAPLSPGQPGVSQMPLVSPNDPASNIPQKKAKVRKKKQGKLRVSPEPSSPVNKP